MFSVAAVAVAAASAIVGRYMPYNPNLSLASEAVDSILNVIATSMLAVTTFSLSIMVAAYSSATSNVTPRSTKILLADPVAQNTLSTFLGSFLFAIVGIIGLAAGVYDDNGRVILFFATLVVVAIISLTLLRWINQLGHFGRVGDTIARVEKATRPAFVAEGTRPALGSLPPKPFPAEQTSVYPGESGCVTHVDMARLDRLACRLSVDVQLEVLPGALVFPTRKLLSISPPVIADDERSFRNCVTIDRAREFDQDPRYGLVVLAEIASRALSPAVNDPGTAIDALGAILRTLLAFVDAAAESEPPHCTRVYARRIEPLDFLSTGIDPIIRDGTGNIEVELRILKILKALKDHDPLTFSEPAAALVSRLLERARPQDRVDHERRSLLEASRYASIKN